MSAINIPLTSIQFWIRGCYDVTIQDAYLADDEARNTLAERFPHGRGSYTLNFISANGKVSETYSTFGCTLAKGLLTFHLRPKDR